MNDKYRMYGLVPYNLSPIQQGIQFGHAVVEYSLAPTLQFNKWAKECKTFIVLNGGTTNNNPEKLGTLNQHLQTLKEMGVKCVTFSEPDLGDQLTAVVFLVEEMVYNKEEYPDFDSEGIPAIEQSQDEYRWNRDVFGSAEQANKVIEMRTFLSQFRLA